MPSLDTVPDRPVTGELLARLPIDGRCELVEGRVVRMSPTGRRHARIEAILGRILDEHAQERSLGEVYVGEVGIYTRRSPDTVRGADAAFISSGRLAQLDAEAAFLTVAPEIVVEILSPSDRAEDVEQKTSEYLSADVLEVWIVDPAEQGLTRRRQGSRSAETFVRGQTLTTPILPGFELPLERLFAA